MEHDPVLDAFGPRLRALRQQRGVTLAGLSAATGISVSTLSRLESGRRKPTLELLLLLARVHQAPLDELVGMPAPGDPLASVLTPLTVTLGGTNLPIMYAGLAPGEVGVYQVNVAIPQNTPQGLGVPLNISQGGFSHTFDLRVVQ